MVHEEDNEVRSDGNVESSEQSSEQKKKLQFDEHVTATWIDHFFDFLRKGKISNYLEEFDKWLTKVGLYGLYVTAVLGFIVSIVLPLKYKELPFDYFLGIGVSWFLICIVIHYTAYKFIPNIKLIINATPSKLSTKAILDSSAIINAIVSVICLISGIYLGLKTPSFEIFMTLILISIFTGYMALISLHPHLLNISISKATRAGEEFIGILSFSMKSFLKIIPALFGVGIIFCVLKILDLLLLTDIAFVPQLFSAGFQIGLLVAFGLLPIVGYLLFLGYYLLLDIANSILTLPQKIEEIKEAKNSKNNI